MPILHSNLETDLRLAVALDQALLTTLTDMATVRNIPGLIDFHGTVNGTGSDTGRLRYANLGGASHFAVTAAENTAVAETAITDASVDIAVVRTALRRDVGDLAIATGFGDDVDPDRLAADMIASYEGYFNVLYTTAGGTAATDVGTTTVDMSVNDYFDAIFTLEIADAPGPYFCALAPRQLADFQSSLRAEGSALMYHAATPEMLAIKGQGFAGEYLGVQILKLSDVITTGGDREGFMHGVNAFGYKVAIVDQRSMLGAGASVAVRADEVLVEIVRNTTAATVTVMGNAWVGLSLKEQARVVGIVTDA